MLCSLSPFSSRHVTNKLYSYFILLFILENDASEDIKIKRMTQVAESEKQTKQNTQFCLRHFSASRVYSKFITSKWIL